MLQPPHTIKHTVTAAQQIEGEKQLNRNMVVRNRSSALDDGANGRHVAAIGVMVVDVCSFPHPSHLPIEKTKGGRKSR